MYCIEILPDLTVRASLTNENLSTVNCCDHFQQVSDDKVPWKIVNGALRQRVTFAVIWTLDGSIFRDAFNAETTERVQAWQQAGIHINLEANAARKALLDFFHVVHFSEM
mmetsp:Transcript_37959/g.61496  ORF Transcript_37959/g.61496 Transcript_37959/m.61496 type:complete len:110 (-) Transcript_37959:9-338(-)